MNVKFFGPNAVAAGGAVVAGVGAAETAPNSNCGGLLSKSDGDGPLEYLLYFIILWKIKAIT